MFLLSRPPLLRWMAATALVAAALWADLRPPELTGHPFLVVDVVAGEVIDATMVETRPVVPGTFEEVDLPVTAARPMAAGDPVTGAGVEATAPAAPDGWLMVELAVPHGASPNAEVVVVVSGDGAEPRLFTGIVVATGIEDQVGGEVASCAFPPQEAALVAVAVSERRASVLVGG